MCPGYERSQSLKPRRSSSLSWAADGSIPLDCGYAENDQEQPRSDAEEEEDDDDEEGGRRMMNRRSSSYYFDRQMYLHSYTFSRKMSVCDKLRGSVKRLKSTAWAVIACNYCPKFNSKSSSNRSSSSNSTGSKLRRLCRAPFLISFKPRCIQVPA